MTVAAIVEDVRRRGDAALWDWSLRLDGVEPVRATPADVIPESAVLALADRVRRWHALQRPADIRLEIEPGVELERRWVPLRSVGVYVPRALVSTLVMCAVPAQVAGVERIVVATPPSGAPEVAAAAALLGIDEVWAVGGAQAIAALAYGTEAIARVDKIVGPGNVHVNEAKLLVSRDVAIDLPAGPSEVVVVLAHLGARDPCGHAIHGIAGLVRDGDDVARPGVRARAEHDQVVCSRAEHDVLRLDARVVRDRAQQLRVAAVAVGVDLRERLRRLRPLVRPEACCEGPHRTTACACAGMPSTAASSSTVERTRASPAGLSRCTVNGFRNVSSPRPPTDRAQPFVGST